MTLQTQFLLFSLGGRSFSSDNSRLGQRGLQLLRNPVSLFSFSVIPTGVTRHFLVRRSVACRASASGAPHVSPPRKGWVAVPQPSSAVGATRSYSAVAQPFLAVRLYIASIAISFAIQGSL
jgi:hypothetical protein